MIDEDGKPVRLVWSFSRAELIADGVVHVLGSTFALSAGVTLVVLCALFATGPSLAAASVYAVTLVATFGISAAYNVWPVCRTKWTLRRFDHATIFLLIAGTYTPFLMQVPDRWVSVGLLSGVWLVALAGTVLKLGFPGQLDRLSIGLYLALGWSGLLASNTVMAVLPPSAIWLIGIGGVLYTVGVVFHVWEKLRFQNAVWHGFVLAAAGCHYAAVVDSLVLAPA
ncbi:PAQR family membrane homeostasis protein TrhA [Labrys wisconsinensis]|uniref:Hemolysin III n=1 Tax=Labrys wisconsinensis TaxID=425677 RepID=A0ABU0IYV8_9HYPH|nr:hemolysin III family protein [Labrys wisconsinensis]MDQ0467200.1 hemolysin III [Labrys wisconsinensis]